VLASRGPSHRPAVGILACLIVGGAKRGSTCCRSGIDHLRILCKAARSAFGFRASCVSAGKVRAGETGIYHVEADRRGRWVGDGFSRLWGRVAWTRIRAMKPRAPAARASSASMASASRASFRDLLRRLGRVFQTDRSRTSPRRCGQLSASVRAKPLRC
jgi:hypothetical protein